MYFKYGFGDLVPEEEGSSCGADSSSILKYILHFYIVKKIRKTKYKMNMQTQTYLIPGLKRFAPS